MQQVHLKAAEPHACPCRSAGTCDVWPTVTALEPHWWQWWHFVPYASQFMRTHPGAADKLHALQLSLRLQYAISFDNGSLYLSAYAAAESIQHSAAKLSAFE